MSNAMKRLVALSNGGAGVAGQPDIMLVAGVCFRTQPAPDRPAATRLTQALARCAHLGSLGGDQRIWHGDLPIVSTEKPDPRFGNTPTDEVHRTLFHPSRGASQASLTSLAQSIRLHDREPRRTCRDVLLCRSHPEFRGHVRRPRIGACRVRQGHRSDGGNHGATAGDFLRDHRRPRRSAGEDPLHRGDGLTVGGGRRGSGEQR